LYDEYSTATARSSIVFAVRDAGFTRSSDGALQQATGLQRGRIVRKLDRASWLPGSPGQL